MDSKGMTQQTFAKYLGISSSALSNILNGRTKPTMSIFMSIIDKFSGLNPIWLMKGIDPMYLPEDQGQVAKSEPVAPHSIQTEIDFLDDADEEMRAGTGRGKKKAQESQPHAIELKKQDKVKRRVNSITVYYDDDTFETFIPAKPK